ncbi:hypothetical protein [Actinocorallia longicatena]|uniref:DUF2029 domain-containing protein n=1 Tax=Actinocorallia longicatena TaxID=111803 RepID=A0ABP6QGW5_9ACTN
MALLLALSVALMLLAGLLGPSATLPEGDWPVRLGDPGDLPVIALLWSSLLLGLGGTLLGLRRAGPEPGSGTARGLFLFGTASAVVLALVPPLGSTDLMDYATYGRLAVLGHNPHEWTPADLRSLGDPVALLSSEAWRNTPSVYGPVATAVQWGAALLGGGSAAAIVLVLKLVNALSFVAAGAVLTRLTSPVRAHLLWTANPLMLWAVCAGGHLDGLATAAAIGFLYLLLRGHPLVAGVLLGCASAVKAPFALFASAALVTPGRRCPDAGPVAVGAAAVLLAGYAAVGTAAVRALAERGGTWSFLSPWLQLNRWVPVGSWLPWAAAALLAWVFLRGLPDGPREVRTVLALALAWVLTTPIYHPWYDVMLFGALAIMPASRLDTVLALRGTATALCVLPGVRLSSPWLSDAGNSASTSVPLVLLAFTLLVAVMAGRGAFGAAPVPLPPPGAPLEPAGAGLRQSGT